jgi:hypothetical protein
MGNNFLKIEKEKSNIATAILEKLKLFCILGAPILFSYNIYPNAHFYYLLIKLI